MFRRNPQEGLDSEGGHSAPEAEGVDDNGEYSSQQMLTDSECNGQVPQQGVMTKSKYGCSSGP